MPDTFVSARAVARSFTDSAVSARMADLRHALAASVRALIALRDAGVPKDAVADLASQISDEIANLEAACARDLDDVGLMPLDGLDYAELRALVTPWENVVRVG